MTKFNITGITSELRHDVAGLLDLPLEVREAVAKLLGTYQPDAVVAISGSYVANDTGADFQVAINVQAPPVAVEEPVAETPAADVPPADAEPPAPEAAPDVPADVPPAEAPADAPPVFGGDASGDGSGAGA